jgi:hypothetical protein
MGRARMRPPSSGMKSASLTPAWAMPHPATPAALSEAARASSISRPPSRSRARFEPGTGEYTNTARPL